MPTPPPAPARPRTPAEAPTSPGDTGSALQTADTDVFTETFRAVFSSHQRAGRWEASDEIEARAVFGEVTLDFTRAELPPSGTVEIHASAIFGEVHIIVPDGADVDIDGTPVLGSIEQHLRRKGAREKIREWVTGEREEDLPAPGPSVERPYFHVTGRAILGTVKVTGR
ncbi:MAG: cell wall-active antibiotics response protein [Proteobacteria bacterium]|nr:cell wall-active antibiotics response protein [Pseudomonadota bacterium]